MATVGSANIDITADSSQARGEVTGLTGFLRRTGSIAAGIAGGFGIFEAVKASFGGLAKSTIGANASMEQYQNTLSVVQGSSEKAAKTMDWVKKFAAKTPFEIPGLVDATVKLESYGINAQSVLGDIGDMAAVMGKPLNSAVEAVADAQTGELERLKEFGITKQNLIDQSAKMGLGEIVNAKGQITNMEGLNKALFALMKDRFHGGMEIQSQSFNGMISNVKDSMGQVAQILSQPLFEKLEAGLKNVVPVLSAFVSFVKGDTKGAMDTLKAQFGPDKAQAIMDFFSGMKTAAKEFWDMFNGLLPLIVGVVAGFATFRSIMWVIEFIKAMRLAWIAMNLAMEANPIVLIISLIVGLIAMLVVLYMKNETFRNAVQAAWQGIKDAFNAVITWATTTLPAWWESLKAGFMNMVNAIMVIIQPFVTFFVQTWENMKLLVLGIVEVFIGLLTGNFDKVKLGLLAIWTAIKNQAVAYWNLLKSTVIALVIGIAKGIANGFQNAKDWAVQKVKDLYNGVVNWVKSIPGKFTEMKNNVIKEVKSIDLVQIGKNVVQGLLNGLGSMLQKVKDKAKEISNAVEKAIKDKLKIKSPSRVMIEVGQFTGEGFVLGLDETINQAIEKAKQLGQSVTDAVAGAKQKYNAGLFQFKEDNPIAKYFNAIIQDGDYMNDWVTHMPKAIRGQMMDFGKQFSQFEGLKSSVLGGGSQQQPVTEEHVHYWQINADEITDVARLIDVINGVVQSVRSR